MLYYTLVGRDDAGDAVKVPVAIRLDSSVGARRRRRTPGRVAPLARPTASQNSV
jgi:hypothetical protein